MQVEGLKVEQKLEFTSLNYLRKKPQNPISQKIHTLTVTCQQLPPCSEETSYSPEQWLTYFSAFLVIQDKEVNLNLITGLVKEWEAQPEQSLRLLVCLTKRVSDSKIFMDLFLEICKNPLADTKKAVKYRAQIAASLLEKNKLEKEEVYKIIEGLLRYAKLEQAARLLLELEESLCKFQISIDDKFTEIKKKIESLKELFNKKSIHFIKEEFSEQTETLFYYLKQFSKQIDLAIFYKNFVEHLANHPVCTVYVNDLIDTENSKESHILLDTVQNSSTPIDSQIFAPLAITFYAQNFKYIAYLLETNLSVFLNAFNTNSKLSLTKVSLHFFQTLPKQKALQPKNFVSTLETILLTVKKDPKAKDHFLNLMKIYRKMYCDIDFLPNPELDTESEQKTQINQLESLLKSKKNTEAAVILKSLLAQEMKKPEFITRLSDCIIKFHSNIAANFAFCLSSKNVPKQACRGAVCANYLNHLVDAKFSHETFNEIIAILQFHRVSDPKVARKIVLYFELELNAKFSHETLDKILPILQFVPVSDEESAKKIMHFFEIANATHKSKVLSLVNQNSLPYLLGKDGQETIRMLTQLSLAQNNPHVITELITFDAERFKNAFPIISSKKSKVKVLTFFEVLEKYLPLLQPQIKTLDANTLLTKLNFLLLFLAKNPIPHSLFNLIHRYVNLCVASTSLSNYANCFNLITNYVALPSSGHKNQELVELVIFFLNNLSENYESLASLDYESFRILGSWTNILGALIKDKPINVLLFAKFLILHKRISDRIAPDNFTDAPVLSMGTFVTKALAEYKKVELMPFAEFISEIIHKLLKSNSSEANRMGITCLAYPITKEVCADTEPPFAFLLRLGFTKELQNAKHDLIGSILKKYLDLPHVHFKEKKFFWITIVDHILLLELKIHREVMSQKAKEDLKQNLKQLFKAIDLINTNKIDIKLLFIERKIYSFYYLPEYYYPKIFKDLKEIAPLISNPRQLSKLYRGFLTLKVPKSEHAQNCQDLLKLAQVNPKTNELYNYYLTEKLSEGSSSQILYTLIKSITTSEDFPVQAYLAKLFINHPHAFSLENISLFIVCIKKGANPFLFLTGAYLLLKYAERAKKEEPIVYSIFQSFAENFIQSFSPKILDAGSCQYLSVWEILVELFIDQGLYELDHNDFFIITSLTAMMSYKAKGESFAYGNFFSLLRLIPKLEKDLPPEKIENFAYQKDILYKKTLDLFNDGIREEEKPVIFGLFNIFLQKDPRLKTSIQLLDKLLKDFPREKLITDEQAYIQTSKLNKEFFVTNFPQALASVPPSYVPFPSLLSN